MKRVWRGLVAVPAVAVLITAGTTAVASAASSVNGKPSGPPPAASPGEVWCVSTSGAKACFAAYGDKVWVEDTSANGEAVAGTIKADLPGNWYAECYDGSGKAAGWVMCDFDVPENSKGRLWAVNNPFIGSQSYTNINTSGAI